MKDWPIVKEVVTWFKQGLSGWNRFWFIPQLPHTLAMIRIATGGMLTYTHVVLLFHLDAFLGANAWVSSDLSRQLKDGTFGVSESGWSYLWFIDSPNILLCHQVVAILLSLALMLGVLTRVTAPLAWFVQLMFMHRLTGALFGLDQVTTMLAMYLMLAPCGSVYSVDAWLRGKMVRQRQVKTATGKRRLASWTEMLLPTDLPNSMTRIATRLAQLHLCLIYLFGGLWKARGEAWWDGMALWLAAVNYEYQSNDLTWIARYPLLFQALTHLTVFWETFYCALVWPRWSRPVVLFIALMVHGGIAIFLGMVTFGSMMIVANGVFIEPEIVRSTITSIARRLRR